MSDYNSTDLLPPDCPSTRECEWWHPREGCKRPVEDMDAEPVGGLSVYGLPLGGEKRRWDKADTAQLVGWGLLAVSLIGLLWLWIGG